MSQRIERVQLRARPEAHCGPLGLALQSNGYSCIRRKGRAARAWRHELVLEELVCVQTDAHDVRPAAKGQENKHLASGPQII